MTRWLAWVSGRWEKGIQRTLIGLGWTASNVEDRDVFPLGRASRALALCEAGRTRGKIVVRVLAE